MPLLVLLGGFLLAVVGILAAAALEVLAELLDGFGHDDRIPVRIERRRVRQARPERTPELDSAVAKLLASLLPPRQ